MSTATKKRRKGRATDSYLALIQETPLRAIKKREDYDVASRMIDRLAVRDDLDDGENLYLGALEVLIEAYEEKVAPVAVDDRTPLQRLQAIMRTSGVTAVQLRTILGASQSMVSMILGGQRALSKKAIGKLAEYFKIEPGYFL